MIEPERLYRVAEVAEILRCSTANIYGLFKRGSLARTSVGANRKGLRVLGSDLAAFLESQTEGGPQPKGNFKHLRRWIQ